MPTLKVVTKVNSPMRWAGGKRWLISRYPELFEITEGRLIEPFAGSAAIFFGSSPPQAFLSDCNAELIDVYKALKEDHLGVVSALSKHAENHRKEYYYNQRSSRPDKLVDRAARTIYLNRTCFNALYRVNLKGVFNVPIGTKSSVFRPDDDFEAVSSLLKRADLACCDFENTIDESVSGDLLFVDPPYTVRHNLNGFVKYNEKIFTFEDQIRLSKSLTRACQRGVDVIVSNADHSSIRNLYITFGAIETIQRSSTLAGIGGVRGETTEVLILSESLMGKLEKLKFKRHLNKFL
jgi:DNA adenine methylase